jgi:hypothetical protein
MRRLTIVLSLVLAAGLSVQAVHSTGTFSAASEQQRLESYVGKYPSGLFKGVPSLKQRLRTLLGANYNFFMQRLQTEMPIEKDQGALVGRGCMAHSCGSEETVFVINLADGKIHCAILSQKYGGKFRTFSEDKNHIPAALTRAIRQP